MPVYRSVIFAMPKCTTVTIYAEELLQQTILGLSAFPVPGGSNKIMNEVVEFIAHSV